MKRYREIDCNEMRCNEKDMWDDMEMLLYAWAIRPKGNKMKR